MQDQELTGWFELSEQAPWEPGVYEVNSFFGGEVYSYWDGEKFKYIAVNKERAFQERHSQTGRLESEIRWRGLSSDPNAKPKPKRSGNQKVTRYVVMDWDEPQATFSNPKNAEAYIESLGYGYIKKIRFRSPE